MRNEEWRCKSLRDLIGFKKRIPSLVRFCCPIVTLKYKNSSYVIARSEATRQSGFL